MTTLRVVVDPVGDEPASGVGRYSADLTRELISTAPRGCDVEGIVAARPQADYDRIDDLLPGLTSLRKAPLGRRELAIAWQTGLVRIPGRGMVHGTSLLAPLYRHDLVNEPGTQTVVTIHDARAWTRPDSLPASTARWQRSMARRAYRFADAVVVPTHTVALELGEHIDFSDRLRVIGAAAPRAVVVPRDADAVADRLGLPERFILTVGSLEPRRGLEPLLEALAHPDDPGLPLVVVGPDTWNGLGLADTVERLGLGEERVRSIPNPSDSELAVLLQRASLFVYPSLEETDGSPLLAALSLGTPLIVSDAPALVELADEAAIVITRDDRAGYPERLAQAMYQVANDLELSTRLGIVGLDRSHAFSWRDSAEKVWQLHADL